LRQDFWLPIELIFVNDGQQPVREWFDHRIGPWDDEYRRGMVRPWMIDLGRRKGRFGLYGRNIGAMAASFENIVFLDDDVTWESPDYLSLMVKAHEKTGKRPYSDLKVVGKVDKSYVREKDVRFAPDKIDLGNLMYSRSLFRKYGYFVDSIDAAIKFDWALIRRIYEGEGEDAFVRSGARMTFAHARH
jgi:glycosyltransferase involved in cell wall biosynthesis